MSQHLRTNIITTNKLIMPFLVSIRRCSQTAISFDLSLVVHYFLLLILFLIQFLRSWLSNLFDVLYKGS